jgi:arginine N-succinyltransferase
MHRIRPIRDSDLKAILELIPFTGLGLTSLPKDKTLLKSHVHKGAETFLKELPDPFYFFVLEDEDTLEIVGTAGINSHTSNLKYFKQEGNILKQIQDKEGPTEICALFLHPKARKEGLGKLLSLSRFHFIAAFPERISNQVFAILRGFIDEQGDSPFWDAIGRHYIPISFEQLTNEREVNEAAVLAKIPEVIAIDSLPENAQKVIGEPHVDGEIALEMLIKQGFKKTGEVDIYEGGPRVMANTADIKTVQESRAFSIKSIQSINTTPLQLISNEKLDFRACFGHVDPDSGSIDQETARSLEVIVGDQVRYSP